MDAYRPDVEKLAALRAAMLNSQFLEAGGFVVRTDHPTDRRRKVIRLTEAGFDKACAIWGDLASYEEQIMEAFTKREIELFKRLNLKLAARLRELG